MPYLIVCPLSQIDAMAQSHNPNQMLTLINEHMNVELPPSIPETNYLRLNFNDIDEPREGLVLADEAHMSQLLQFIKGWNREQPMLIHCWAGVSRSTAGALIALSALNPTLEAAQAAERLRKASPTATPNRHLMTLADKALNRSGELLKASQNIGRGADVRLEAKPFVLALD
jgi:predicted protein tyrosine phosphatase